MYLIAASTHTDIASVRSGSPELWRNIRRFNVPVQLALAAGAEVAAAAEDPGDMALLSIAPCNNGSPELLGWVRTLQLLAPRGEVHTMRVNPTVTLHAVDNLALSALSMALGNRRVNLGIGGAAGMAWEALDIVRRRMQDDEDREALVMAGDQEDGDSGRCAQGVALLFRARPAPYPPLGRPVRVCAIERAESPAASLVTRHSAAGLAALVAALASRATPGRWTYDVPVDHGDGLDDITVIMEIG